MSDLSNREKEIVMKFVTLAEERLKSLRELVPSINESWDEEKQSDLRISLGDSITPLNLALEELSR